MRILISNDDGYQAPGIIALFNAMKEIADVEVVAPEQNNSAKSNALTLHSPIYIHHAENGFKYVTGTPADCVHIALTGLLGYKPDLIVSGINNGANMGDDTLYSGTVAAASEGYLFGIPAIAFSLVSRSWSNLDAAVAQAQRLVAHQLAQPVTGQMLLNVNFPDLPLSQVKGVAATRLGKRHPSQPVVRSATPYGETVYWIGPAGAANDASEGTDFDAIKQGFVSVTPLRLDLTQHAQLSQMTEWVRPLCE